VERRPHDTLDGHCLAEDVLHALACGALEDQLRSKALDHLEACESCQALLAAEMRALAQPVSTDAGASATLIPLETLVGGRYRIKRFIARGGMGEVYVAWDTLLAERVALKTLNPLATAADQVKASARFRQEVQLSRRVADPHVCRIYEFGQHLVPGFGGLSYLTMEFIEGQTLGARLRKGPRLEMAEVLELGRQLLRGLGAAHRVGVLHRDFKSDNVMLRAQPPGPAATPQAVIMDFGLARLLADEAQRLTNSHELVGSAAYMAPEQLEDGASLSAATDIYAFGVVLFEMLTGHLPFDGKSALATALRRLSHPAPPPSNHVPGLSREWDALVLRCLERDPSRRFLSTTEVAVALEAVASRPVVVANARRRSLGVRALAAVSSVAVIAGMAHVWSSRATADALDAAPNAPDARQGTLTPRPALATDAVREASASETAVAVPLPMPDPVVPMPLPTPDGSPPRLEPAVVTPAPVAPAATPLAPAATPLAPAATPLAPAATRSPVTKAAAAPRGPSFNAGVENASAPRAPAPDADAIAPPPAIDRVEDVRDIFFLEPPSSAPQNSER
jgi:hypothetical protein